MTSQGQRTDPVTGLTYHVDDNLPPRPTHASITDQTATLGVAARLLSTPFHDPASLRARLIQFVEDEPALLDWYRDIVKPVDANRPRGVVHRDVLVVLEGLVRARDEAKVIAQAQAQQDALERARIAQEQAVLEEQRVEATRVERLRLQAEMEARAEVERLEAEELAKKSKKGGAKPKTPPAKKAPSTVPLDSLPMAPLPPLEVISIFHLPTLPTPQPLSLAPSSPSSPPPPPPPFFSVFLSPLAATVQSRPVPPKEFRYTALTLPL